MVKVNLHDLELNDFSGKNGSKQHCRATFPLFGAHGTESMATVYFELDPGDVLGRHTDSAEEILFILEGDLDAEVDGKTISVSKGDLILVPRMVPHNLTNSGKSHAKILGIFGGANQVISTFEDAWMPVDTNVVDTSLLME